ncbi:MAG: hypothetical protein AAF518_15385 [Spirochaetota bacterium]
MQKDKVSSTITINLDEEFDQKRYTFLNQSVEMGISPFISYLWVLVLGAGAFFTIDRLILDHTQIPPLFSTFGIAVVGALLASIVSQIVFRLSILRWDEGVSSLMNIESKFKNLSLLILSKKKDASPEGLLEIFKILEYLALAMYMYFSREISFSVIYNGKVLSQGYYEKIFAILLEKMQQNSISTDLNLINGEIVKLNDNVATLRKLAYVSIPKELYIVTICSFLLCIVPCIFVIINLTGKEYTIFKLIGFLSYIISLYIAAAVTRMMFNMENPITKTYGNQKVIEYLKRTLAIISSLKAQIQK